MSKNPLNITKMIDEKTPRKGLVAMSGGVDSSVAALLLQKQNYQCTAMSLKLYDATAIGYIAESGCCAEDDISDARSVALCLHMKHYVWNFQELFQKEVIDPFISAYEKGETPNPCINCNRAIKFGALLERARGMDYDFLATGHYARVLFNKETGRYNLKRAVDKKKDQSYFLASLTQDQLAHVEFPLGEYTKPQVRDIATQHGFLNARKHDSMDICFVPEGKYDNFIHNYTQKNYPRGNFIDTKGNILGKHRGIIHYTIGQRRHLGVNFSEPLYVCDIDSISNTITLGTRKEIYTRTAIAHDCNWISIDKLDTPLHVTAKIRSVGGESPAIIYPIENNRTKIEFDAPVWAISSGQAAVFYDGETVVGSGTLINQ